MHHEILLQQSRQKHDALCLRGERRCKNTSPLSSNAFGQRRGGERWGGGAEERRWEASAVEEAEPGGDEAEGDGAAPSTSVGRDPLTTAEIWRAAASSPAAAAWPLRPGAASPLHPVASTRGGNPAAPARPR